MTDRSDPDGYVIRPASVSDVPALLELQEANLLAAGGSLSVRSSSEWFERSIAEMPIIVAERDGKLVGYLVSSSRAATRHLPLSEAKYKAYPAGPDAYNSGPLCVAASERGQGLAPRLHEAMRIQLAGRQAVAFVRSDNAASRALHRKLGFQEVAEFRMGDVEHVVVTRRNVSPSAPFEK